MPVRSRRHHVEGLPVVGSDRVNDDGAAIAVARQVPGRRQVVAVEGDLGRMGPVGDRERAAGGIAQKGHLRLDPITHVGQVHRIRSGQSRRRP